MIEYRTVSGDAQAVEGKLSGRVTPFNSQTAIGDLRAGGFREQVAPGAFKKTLQERDIVLLFNHNKDMPLARTSAGNLSLREAGDGLHMDATPVPTSYGEDLMKLAQAGVIRGMSFGFEVIKDDWLDDAGQPSNKSVGTQRTIREVKLHEVSAVTFPAYEDTTISARDAISAAREPRAGVRNEIPEGWDWRDKYNAADRKAMAGREAMDDGSYPIKDAEDLHNAILAVGRGNASHDAIRRHIIARAKALGLSSAIPSNWSADGSEKEQNSMTLDLEMRDAVDGDDPNGEFYQAFTNGAISDLEAISTKYSHQIPANVADAIAQICAFHKTLGEHVPAAGGTGGDGITPPSPEGPTAEAHSEDDEDWEMRARVAMVQAQTRATEMLLAGLGR